MNEMNEQNKKNIEDIIDFLSFYLKSIDNNISLDFEYYICGGAVYDAFINKKFLNDSNDVDIFFTSKKNFNLFLDIMNNKSDKGLMYKEMETHNAVTFKLNNKKIIENFLTKNFLIEKKEDHPFFDDSYPKYGVKIQLIKHIEPSIKDILNTFDLNKSKIAISNTKKIYIDESFYNKLTIDYNNFNIQTTRRFMKYIKEKNVEKNLNEFYNIIDYLNGFPIDKTFKFYYEPEDNENLNDFNKKPPKNIEKNILNVYMDSILDVLYYESTDFFDKEYFIFIDCLNSFIDFIDKKSEFRYIENIKYNINNIKNILRNLKNHVKINTTNYNKLKCTMFTKKIEKIEKRVNSTFGYMFI